MNQETHALRVSASWVLSLWSMYIALSPVYLWKSGLPQIADFLLIATIMAYWGARARIEIPARGSMPVALFSLFIVLAWVVTFFHAITFLPMMIMEPIRLTFNLLVFLFILELSWKFSREFLVFTVIGIVGAYVVIVASGLNPAGGREEGTFNNPNQLAYMSVLCAAFINLAFWRRVIPLIVAAPMLAIVIPIGFLGISFAAAVCLSICALTFATILMQQVLRASATQKSMLILLATAIMMGGWFVLEMKATPTPALKVDMALVRLVIDRYQGRASSKLEGKVEGLASGDERGLAVFSTHPENIIWGAGRGGNDRYGDRHELHASLPAVLYSYGFIGFLLFMGAFGVVHWRASVMGGIVTLPVWLWSFAHYGLNFPLFWALMAFLAAGGANRADAARREWHRTPPVRTKLPESRLLA